MNESGGFLTWKVGQTPNVALLFLGYCCCCGLPLLLQLHAFRNELKSSFEEIDDNLHWVYVIIGIFGLYQNEQQLNSLEAKYSVNAAPNSLPWWLPLIVPVLWPLAIANQMRRLNELVAAAKK